MSKRTPKTETPEAEVEWTVANPEVPVTEGQISALASLLLDNVTRTMKAIELPDGRIVYMKCDDVLYVDDEEKS